MREGVFFTWYISQSEKSKILNSQNKKNKNISNIIYSVLEDYRLADKKGLYYRWNSYDLPGGDYEVSNKRRKYDDEGYQALFRRTLQIKRRCTRWNKGVSWKTSWIFWRRSVPTSFLGMKKLWDGKKTYFALLKIIQLGNVRIAARRIQLSDIEKLLRKAMAMERFGVMIAEKVIFLIERI